jgi:O-antigen/teichoic acid export membrane protein
MEARLKRNVFFMALDAVVTIVASLTQLAVIAREYEPQFVGDYQFAQATLFLIWAFSCAGGITMVVTRDLATSDHSKHRSIISNAVALQGVISMLIVLGLYLLEGRFDASSSVITAILFGAIVSLLASLLQVSQSLLVSAEKISTVASVSIGANIAATLIVTSASWAKVSLSALVIAVLSCQAIRAVWVTILTKAWRYISLRLIKSNELLSLMRQALPVLVMIVATHLYVRVDVLMLTYWTDRETVARYGSAYAFLDQLMILSNFMMGALFPNFARVALARGVEYRTLYRGILLLFGKYLLPIAVLIAIFSRSLLAGVYGPEYSQAGVALSILMVAALFAWINGPAGTIFISLGKQSLYMWATIVSLVVNIIGNIILIPLVGAIGSAIATVLTEAALCIVCLVWIHQITGWLPWMEINERRDGT